MYVEFNTLGSSLLHHNIIIIIIHVVALCGPMHMCCYARTHDAYLEQCPYCDCFTLCTNGVRTRSNKKMIFSHTLIHSYVHLYHSPFPLPSSHPGSLATTPAAVETGTYLRAGAPVLLQGTVCQESEGPSHNITCKV